VRPARVTQCDSGGGQLRRPEGGQGNKQAIVNSYNYSVAMEERVANRFNEAVRSYKERKAAAEG
jgi:hypothetical protein